MSPMNVETTTSNFAYKSQDVNKTRIHQEFELVYKELQKAREIELNKASIPYQKLQHHDPEKWKKKLKMLLDREHIIAIDGHSSGLNISKFAKQFQSSQCLIESIKHCKAVGADIMALPKFWAVLFTLGNVEKLDGGLSALARFNVPGTEDSLAVLRSALAISEPIECEPGTNPFLVDSDEQLNNSLVVNTTAAFGRESIEATAPLEQSEEPAIEVPKDDPEREQS